MKAFFIISLVFVYKVYCMNIFDAMEELNFLRQRMDRLQHIITDLSKRGDANQSLSIEPFETRTKQTGKIILLLGEYPIQILSHTNINN